MPTVMPVASATDMPGVVSSRIRVVSPCLVTQVTTARRASSPIPASATKRRDATQTAIARHLPKKTRPLATTRRVSLKVSLIGCSQWQGQALSSRYRRKIYRYFFISISAIWTAFRAAPFLMLSETTQRLRPWGTDSSLLILPTKVSSLPAACMARG